MIFPEQRLIAELTLAFCFLGFFWLAYNHFSEPEHVIGRIQERWRLGGEKQAYNEALPAPILTFSLLSWEYEVVEPLSDGKIRRWACVILRNISDDLAKNVIVYAEPEKFYARYTGTDKFVVSDGRIDCEPGQEKIIKVAYRDETTDREFVQEGGNIVFPKKSEFGTADRSGTIRIQAISAESVLCEAKFTLSVGAAGRLMIYEADR